MTHQAKPFAPDACITVAQSFGPSISVMGVPTGAFGRLRYFTEAEWAIARRLQHPERCPTLWSMEGGRLLRYGHASDDWGDDLRSWVRPL